MTKRYWWHCVAMAALYGFVAAGAAQGETATWRPLAAGTQPAEGFAWVCEPLATGVRLRCTLDGFMTRDVKAEGHGFTRLAVPGLGVTGDEGTPELPAWRRFVEVPQEATNVWLTVSEEVAETKAGTVAGLHGPVYPVQPPQVKLPGAATPFAWDQGFYARKAGTCPVTAELASAGVVRGRRLYEVTVYPFDYSPGDHALKLRRSVTVEVHWDGAAKAGLGRDPRYRSPRFDAALDPFVVNGATGPAKGLPALPIGYLVIAAPAFAADASLA